MPASTPSSRPCARKWPNDVRAEAWDEPVGEERDEARAEKIVRAEAWDEPVGEERDEARAEKIVREAWDEPVGEERDEPRAEMIRRLDTARLGAAGVAKALARPPAGVDAEIHRRVEEILSAVREKGDAALLEVTERFDRVRLTAGELAGASAERGAALGAGGEA